MSDVFHEGVPLEYIQEIFQVMQACPQHTFQMLTKRPERARELARKASVAQKCAWMWNKRRGRAVCLDRVA